MHDKKSYFTPKDIKKLPPGFESFSEHSTEAQLKARTINKKAIHVKEYQVSNYHPSPYYKKISQYL